MSNITPIPGLPAHIANLQRQGIDLRLKRTRNGDFVIIPSLYNIVKLLSDSSEYISRIVYDEFTDKICIKNKDWEDFEDYHVDEIRFDFEDRLYTTFKKEDIFSAAEIVAKRNGINPLLDYINKLEWDETPRLDTMLIDYFGIKDTTLHRAYSRRFMISMVARMFATIHKPVKVDTVLVLYGKQGRLKSTALSVIAMDYKFGKKYFSDTPFDMANKDAHLMTQGKILVELQELAKRSKDKEVEKSFISLQIAEFRPPFKRCRIRIPKKCVYAATTNKNLILTDATGSRRFWPVVVGETSDDPNWKIDIKGLRKNIEMIWAEARHLHKNGEFWWLDEDEEKLRIESAADFTDRHPLHEKIMFHANSKTNAQGYVQVTQIIDALYKDPDQNNFNVKHLEKSNRQNKAIISDVLTDEGFEYKRKRIGNRTVRGWFRNEKIKNR